MHKKESKIWEYFKKEFKNKKKYATCIFCKQSYVSNATRMVKHLKNCSKCPHHVKNTFSSRPLPKSRQQINEEHDIDDKIDQCVKIIEDQHGRKIHYIKEGEKIRLI